MSEVEGGEASDAQRKAQEREAKKAEVRKRLEESGKAGKKAKKGFLTPDRKKKLRKLLMVKAAEDLKRQQLQKEQERTTALSSRTIPLPNVDSIDDKGKLEQIYNELFERVKQLEEEKYDINQVVQAKENEINNLNIEVNDLRGKFAKPALKKVSKYDNKFKKMAGEGADKAPKADFRSNLKVVVKSENAIEEALSKKKKGDKPEWSKKEGEEKPKSDEPAAKVKDTTEAAEPEPEEPSEAPEEVEEEEGDEEEEEE